jgi:hypothetical protein
MSLESKAKTLQKEVQDYRNAEMTNKNRLRNPWFRAYRDSLIFSTLLLEEAQKLEADLKRANKKLDTIDAVAKQLVKMTNIATNHRIQIDEAKKQLEEAMDCYDMTREENDWIKDLYEVFIK